MGKTFKRHLLYHLCPFEDNGQWQRRLSALLQRIDLFTGKVIFAVATGPGLDPPAKVKPFIDRVASEVLLIPNDPQLREVATFEPLFQCVQNVDGGDVILWAHAKGVTRQGDLAVNQWITAIEEVYLDHFPRVAEVLETSPVAGAFMRKMRWPEKESRSDWHYSGSWFWFRARDLFCQYDWRAIDRFSHGIETYPSLHWHMHQAGCVIPFELMPVFDGYNLANWSGLQKVLDLWRNRMGRGSKDANVPASTGTAWQPLLP